MVDFDRGMVTPEVLSVVASQLRSTGGLIVVQPYLAWSKYKNFSMHTLVSREELLEAAMSKEFPQDSPFRELPSIDRFFMAFPKCQN